MQCELITLFREFSDHPMYKIGLKTLLQQNILEPVFYRDLVYKFKGAVGKPDFSGQLEMIIKRYKK